MESKSAEWSNRKCLQLISEYKKRPMLWDQKDPFFFRKHQKPDIWNNIGQILGMPGEACRQKMVILLSSFRREKAKLKRSGGKYRSSWFAFEDLMFLMDKEGVALYREARGISSQESTHDETDYDSSAVLYEELEEPDVSVAIHGTKRTSIAADNKSLYIEEKRRRTPEPNPSFKPNPEIASSTMISESRVNNDETDEEVRFFINFIAMKMKKYSESTKNAVQQAICDIIFKADQKFYDNQHKNRRNRPSAQVESTQMVDVNFEMVALENDDDINSVIIKEEEDGLGD